MSAETLLQKVKRYHSESFECIKKALEIDENQNGKKEDALMWYDKGISMLEKGINVPKMGASVDDKTKIIRIQTKMMKNLQMAKERQDCLNAKSSTSESVLSKPTRPHSGPPAAKEPKPGPSSTSIRSKPSSGVLIPKSTATSRARSNIASGKPAVSASRTSNRTPNRPSSAESKINHSQIPESTSKSRIRSKQFKSVSSEMANKIIDAALIEKCVKFDDIAGQEAAKEALKEIVIYPVLRPDLFMGLRSPAKGLLLFGPPGNGKTLLAKAVAGEADATFFNISAATLTSKWVGEGEKMVKALFAVAREVQPSIVFIDEIDSLLRARQENDSDAARKIQTEFFLQFDGVGTNPNDRILVMGATNRPQELDDAALRRFPKRIYVRLPDAQTREHLFKMLLSKLENSLSAADIHKLSKMCDNYSFSDLTDLAKDAAMGPIRELPRDVMMTIEASKMRKINLNDFTKSLHKIRPSVDVSLLRTYEQWNNKHGDTSSL
ncbi:spastin-like [Clavelina lepadiformis]|uniref:spastin-like n=1 Tax=Clavelina lepadiformis TaxID=159417 RepID=UPI004041C9C6